MGSRLRASVGEDVGGKDVDGGSGATAASGDSDKTPCGGTVSGAEIIGLAAKEEADGSVCLGGVKVGVKDAACGFNGEGTVGLYGWKVLAEFESKRGFVGVVGALEEA